MSVLTLFRGRIGWAWYRTKPPRKVTWDTLESTTRSQENGDACVCQDRLGEVSVMGIYNQFFLPQAVCRVLCLVLPSHPEYEIRGVSRITESPMTLLFSLTFSFWVVCLFLECSFASWLPPSFCCFNPNQETPEEETFIPKECSQNIHPLPKQLLEAFPH